ncbi:MAG: hypothetical protein HFF86_03160 [Oscillibacter sp.]|nr:hypothetical protein [Oscillibacter sp.]
MDLNLSKAERDLLRRDMSAAEPYAEDDPILNTLDGDEGDSARWAATTARALLEQDREEKEAAGRPLEPESTPESERRKAVQLNGRKNRQSNRGHPQARQ